MLEGALEIEFNKSKIPLIKKSFWGGLLPIISMAIILSLLFHLIGGFGFKISLINAIPLCVISSAIAIPSVRNLTTSKKEFVIYESSFSDILGVLIFNFFALNETIGFTSVLFFVLQIVIICIISLISIVGLAILLNKITNHVKFVPIILLILLIYAVMKVYHLPALIFILLFGLFVNNIDEIKSFKLINKLRPAHLNREIQKFKDLIIEGTFIIRSLFFLLFGFLIETNELLNVDTFLWSIAIVIIIILIRIVQLKLSNLPILPLLFIAPRGLITILLFLSISPIQRIDIVNKSLITQIICITALFLTVGLMYSKRSLKVNKN